MTANVAVIKCGSYEPALVQQATSQAIDLLGGITNLIRPQSKVLVKPNLLMGIAPESGVVTHPEVVRAAIKILKQVNCKIFVGDGPSVWGKQIENVGQVYLETGITKICQEEDVEVVDFNKRRWRQKFPLTTWLDECDYLVNIPKLKTHGLTLLTGAIKNLFGLVSGTYKIELHKKYSDNKIFSKVLVDIFQEARPALTIVDSIVAMEGDGPGTAGKLRKVNLLLAGADSVAVDSVLALIMGLRPQEILSTKEAAKRALGVADVNAIEILGSRLEEIVGEPFLLPATSMKQMIPQPVINLAKKLIKHYPYVQHANCIRCEACVRACPVKVISMKNKRIEIDYSRCISCFCCLEVCPASAIKLKKSFFAKLAGL